MSRLTSLKAATSLNDLADLLSFKPKYVAYILYKQAADQKYRTFQIPKRNGGERTIKAPQGALKLLQRRVSDLLQDCMEEIASERHLKNRIAHGFKRQRSIMTNAQRHRHRRWVFNLDLEDFFPSINFGRVRGFLIKNRDFGLHQDVATVLAQIACTDNSLPQGSPCSPVISNLIANVLDMRMVKLAAEVGCTYSRYADDLTFSTNRSAFPSEIAAPRVDQRRGGSGPWLPGEPLRAQIEKSGFRINSHKAHLMASASRQAVTGLIVNEKISVPNEYRHNARAMVHRLVTTGEYEVLAQQSGSSGLEKRPGTHNELHGMLGFIDSVDRHHDIQPQRSGSNEETSREKVYRQFLLYSSFYAARRPVIICEGATDNVYLTHAIRSLAAEFPTLASVLPDGKIQLRVRLYKYSKSSTARLLGLKAGGSSALKGFIAAYGKETERFTGPGLIQPIVILYDNDDGAKDLRHTIGNLTKRVVTGTEPFVHVVMNLCAVSTPLAGGATSSKIEDCFDAATKAIVINGKTFNERNGINTAEQYSKTVFAHRVVRPRAETIDFTGFRTLLGNIAAAIHEHSSTTASHATRS